MPNPDATLIAALLDRSGSMVTSKQATEDGWRELLSEQACLPGDCRVTLAQFDTEYEVVYASTPIDEVPEFAVVPRGRTALLDAIGTFVTEIGERLSALPEYRRPGRVVCLIMTDGMENASRQWSWDAVRRLTIQQQDQWNWKFIFLGANIDAIQVGARMGFSYGDSITYDDDDYNSTMGVYRSAREMVRRVREGDDDAAFSDEDRDIAIGTTT
ncbi:VWA domain-containing protein [Mycolicibacterium celeriflavum]|uniref:VWA domain-containing protein n=1 Tax=Mycolicibacterium celeriflavum TaxID=1249101 RepID=UPI003CF38239